MYNGEQDGLSRGGKLLEAFDFLRFTRVLSISVY